MIFADVSPDFWTVTLPTMIGAAIVAAGGIALTAITVAGKVVQAFRDLKASLQKDIKENTDVTKAVMPALAAKVDSATQESKENLAETKRETQTTAAKLALHNEESTAKIMDALGDVGTKIKGEDGTCLTARIKNLEDQHSELARGQSEMKSSIEALRIDIRNALTPTGANI